MSTFTIVGVAQPLTSVMNQRTYAQSDLASPPFRNLYSVGGSLQIGANGDYVGEGGVALYRKLLYRRLYARPGDFFHLPHYGLGVRCKERIPTNNLVKFKAQVEAQVLLEPETASVVANPYTMSGDVLVVEVSATMKKSGTNVDVNVNSQQTGVL